MPRVAAAVLAACAACALGVAGGCAQTTHIVVEAPHTQVLLDGTDIGKVPDGGVDVDIHPGMHPLRYEVRNGPSADAKDAAVGSVARTETVWWMLGLAVGGAVCCAPTTASLGFCVANPGVIGAPIACIAGGDLGAVTSSFVAPTWFTLPVVAGCGALGLSPLALALFSEQVPKNIVLAGSSSPALAPKSEPPKSEPPKSGPPKVEPPKSEPVAMGSKGVAY